MKGSVASFHPYPVPTAEPNATVSSVSQQKQTLSLTVHGQAGETLINEEPLASGVPELTPSPSHNNYAEAASPTIDKTETVDQSPGPANDDIAYFVTGPPERRQSRGPQETNTLPASYPSETFFQDEKLYEEYEFPRVGNGNHSMSSHIEVSGIIIRIDGLPPINTSTVDPTDKPDASLTQETISLGPIEISSILHQIITTSTFQNDNNKSITYINSSSKDEKLISSSSFHTNGPISTESPPENYDILQSNDIYQGSDQPKEIKSSNFPSPLPPEVHRYSIYHGPLESSNPYAHWDSDSEEQEHEMELQRLQELSEEEMEQVDDMDDLDKISKSYIDDTFSEKVETPLLSSPSTPTTGRSYLLLLAGNSTIVRLRQKDFAKYLKLNLAARLSLEYDDVRVNRVVLAPPQLLVNVSVVTPSEAAAAIDSEDALEEEAALDDVVLKEEGPLHMLAETNATLLELSGEEYHVVRLLSLRSHSSDKKLDEEDEDSPAMAIMSDKHNDIELVIYTTVGGACALVILVTLFLTFGRYLRQADIQWPWRRPKSLYTSWTIPTTHLRHRRMGDEYPAPTTAPPTVIYSGSFAARAAAAVSANSWVDEYQTQSGAIIPDDVAPPGNGPLLGVKISPANPLYTDLEMGGTTGNAIMGHNATLYAETSSVQRQSPSKLHIYSCRPGSIVIQPAVPKSHHQIRRNIAENIQLPNNKSKDTHPLDVRIKEDRLGHDNPNYQT
ncbi:hypothetical protein C0J52_19700 [Blattella germanica]|nr:hypothetical protein C0J52_19700 [Blattella germanica]